MTDGRPWRTGIALSGGGIRSATFSLGFFQGLSRLRLLRHVDYLSTVSGGGYFGSFLGALFCRPDISSLMPHDAPNAQQADRAALVEQILSDSTSDPVKSLREDGRYLAPHGAGDLLRYAAVATRNWLAVHVVMVTWCIFLLGLLQFTRLGIGTLEGRFPTPPSWATPLLTFAPLVAIPAAILLLGVVPTAWGYWLVPETDPHTSVLRGWLRWLVPAAIAAIAVLLLTRAPLDRRWLTNDTVRTVLAGVGVVAAATVLWFWATIFATVARNGRSKSKWSIGKLRTVLSQMLTYCLLSLGVTLLVAGIDAAGYVLTQPSIPETGWTTGGLFAGGSALVAAARWVLPKLSALHDDFPQMRVPYAPLAGLVAIVILLAIVVALDVVPQAAAAQRDGLLVLAIVTGVAGSASVLMGRTWPFANRSSLHAIYEARLRRAYLGASNPARKGLRLDQSHPDDGIAWERYHPEARGGPVHLINVTVNETIHGKSQIEQRDRKGLGMAIGPGGISVGATHHAAWHRQDQSQSRFGKFLGAIREIPRWVLGGAREGTFRVFPSPFRPELIGLSGWAAISGAAFSTALGARTSLGYSVLAGLANLRLGYWWDSGIAPRKREGVTRQPVTRTVGRLVRFVFPIQGVLLDEWLARLPGVARERWYLTDGGHFENTAAYELIRRRLDFIVVVDAGADSKYAFTDMGNLVRKARIDFGAKITFLNNAEVTSELHDALRGVIGTPGDLGATGAKQGTSPKSMHAALARVTYHDEDGKQGAPKRWLLWVKPTLSGDESLDVLQYHTANPSFPQQSTLDQFFDEAQWESYRALGAHIAKKLFAPGPSATKWTPREAIGGP